MTVKTLIVRDEGGVFTPANDEIIVSAAKAHLSRRIRKGVAFTSPKVVRDYLAVSLGARECDYFCLALLDARHRLSLWNSLGARSMGQAFIPAKS